MQVTHAPELGGYLVRDGPGFPGLVPYRAVLAEMRHTPGRAETRAGWAERAYRRTTGRAPGAESGPGEYQNDTGSKGHAGENPATSALPPMRLPNPIENQGLE